MQRVLILFMPAKYQPDYIFLRNVPLRRVNIFTAIQIVCLAVLWAIKTVKQVSIVFPLMVCTAYFLPAKVPKLFPYLEEYLNTGRLPEKRGKKEPC